MRQEGKLSHARPSLEGLLKATYAIKEAVDEALEDGDDLVRVVVIGKTGSGKTTATYILERRPVEAVRVDKRLKLQPVELVEGRPVNHTLESQAGQKQRSIPSRWIPKDEKIVFADCAGLLDTDPWVRPLNLYAISRLFKPPCKVKVLIVVSDNQITREGDAVSVFSHVCQLFPNTGQRKRASGLLVTKFDEGL